MRSVIIALALLMAGCSLPYSSLKHRESPYPTKAMSSVLTVSTRLLRKKSFAKDVAKGFPYVVNSTLPANEFIDTAAIYKDKLVSYSARVEFPNTDLIRLIFDYDVAHFGKDVPNPLLFPYPQDADHINNRYYIKFVPVDEFQKLKPAQVWDNEHPLPGIKMQDINYGQTFWLELADGFIAKNYKELYYNEFSSLGLVCQLRLMDGSKVKCYVISSDLYNNTSPRYIRWKIRI